MIAVKATPKGTRMMWKPRVNAIICRAGSTCEESAASTVTASDSDVSMVAPVPRATPPMRPGPHRLAGASGRDAGREPGVVDDQAVVVDGELEGPVPLVAVLPSPVGQPPVGLVDPGHGQPGDVDPGDRRRDRCPPREPGEPVDREGVRQRGRGDVDVEAT